MKQILENNLQKFSFDDFKNHLELVANALAQSNDISLMLRREGDQVFVYSHKRYGGQVNEILEEAKRLHQRKKSEGYNREQAFADFMQAQMEMSKYLQCVPKMAMRPT
ncbi:hypothetical protein L0337_18790 [candidate division KSB1 bacterium]|nr:hypothetical protein [candidate division KSB1 bacterium]